MAEANTVYLSRSGTRQYYKYSNCTSVVMTGQVSSWGSVTGVASTDFVVVPGSAFLAGYGITFTTLTGGAGLNVNTKYYVVNVAGGSFQLSKSQGGAVIDFTTNITAATILVQTDDLMVWSPDYRDTFSINQVTSEIALAQHYGTSSAVLIESGSPPTYTYSYSKSDEMAHVPLRQTQLARSYWKFTLSTAPTTQWAEVLEGDVLSNEVPNTP